MSRQGRCEAYPREGRGYMMIKYVCTCVAAQLIVVNRALAWMSMMMGVVR